MPIVDTQNWKTFKVGELFETHSIGKKVCVPTGGIIAQQALNDGNTPRVTVSGIDNGVVGEFADVNNPNYRVYENFISVSFLGTVFYQEQRTSVDMKVHVLKCAELNRLRGLFLVSIIRATLINCSYAQQLSSSILPILELTLPATPDGQPDWAYMDAYMSEVLKKEEVFAEQLASLTAEAVADGHKLDTSGWKAFRIGELFTQERGKEASPLRVLDGSVNMVAEISNNNGISKQGQSEHIFAGNAVTVSVNYAQNVFYQPYEFCASVNVLILRNSNMTRLSGLFIVSVLRDLHVKFSYVNKISKDLLNSEIVYLPVTSDGQPDWAWMERYMQQQMDKAETLVEHLDAVWG